MEQEQEVTNVSGIVSSNGDVGTDDLLGNLRQLRADAANVFGISKVMEVPGYLGKLAVEYQYINAEVTEEIARSVRRETKNVNGIGTNLLSSLETLIAASKNVLIRKATTDDWVSIDGREHWPESVTRYVNFRDNMKLANLLDYEAGDSRELVLGLYGSEHKVVEANLILSRWLTDKSRTSDEDFLG